jgi:hypothetical protein
MNPPPLSKSLLQSMLVFTIALFLPPSAVCFAQEQNGTSLENPKQALSAGASTTPQPETEKKTELTVRLGNESNQNDGAFGPFTYGLRGRHSFENKLSIEAGYVRLHEPGTPKQNSFLDEAQLTVRLPEHQFMNSGFVIDATVWKNRTIDMYTNLVGLEMTKTGTVSLNAGLYAGSATREEVRGNFVGGQVGVSGTLGPVELALSHLAGRIDSGSYQKSSLEIATNLDFIPRVPVTLTFGVDDRYFDFGGPRPSSDRSDTFIYVTGLELHLEEL